MQHSKRALANMTSQMRGILKFLENDLKNEKLALKKAKTFLKYNLPGTKTMIRHHQNGVKKTMKDIRNHKKLIRKYQIQGKINKIL